MAEGGLPRLCVPAYADDVTVAIGEDREVETLTQAVELDGESVILQGQWG